ncbi:hypothetical protein PTTG_26497 [Puccinia triticina 1-1 BBBD Race 1]|uniref:Uncharacterized protein n=1 Tax=Puccinia triticina (isolate 1-1 / race 1 (BBBD)) TaxID=630390 RepID=A0A180GSW3_PUCT1|nr:hypothetical protein PTTG_26497 [Puccinia triticina 1-1 BBBD Race 1]
MADQQASQPPPPPWVPQNPQTHDQLQLAPPCNNGDSARITKASLNISLGKTINQYILNLHLEHWTDEVDIFKRPYPKTWYTFENYMTAFIRISTVADLDRMPIFLVLDAWKHMSKDISQYGKKLLTAFFGRCAADISHFLKGHCQGRLISVLSGGYCERVLMGQQSGYLLGLMK